MTYWTDDHALDTEQRRLDAQQARAVKRMATPPLAPPDARTGLRWPLLGDEEDDLDDTER